MSKSHAIRYLLSRPALSEMLSNWMLHLSQYDIVCSTPNMIKGQAVADLLAQFPSENPWHEEHASEDAPLVPEEIHGEDICTIEEQEVHTMYFDGSAVAGGGRAEVVIFKEHALPKVLSFKLDFPCSNNSAEYEAYVLRLLAARDMRIEHLKVVGDSKLVISQVKGDFALRQPKLAPYRSLAQKIQSFFKSIEIHHVRRSRNHYVDALTTFISNFNFSRDSVTLRIWKK